MLNQIRAQSRRDQMLILIFAILILYVISTWIIVLSGIPKYYQRVSTQTVPMIQMGSEEQFSNASIAENAKLRGLTLEQYAVYTILNSLFNLVIFGAAALLILWKAGGNWFAWYTVFILLFFPTGGALNQINQVSQVLGNYYGLGAILWPLYLLYLYLFPNGRALPKWTRWPMATIFVFHLALMVIGFLITFGIDVKFLPIWDRLGFIVILAGFPLILVSQVLRYRGYSTPVERYQTKWFISSLAFYIFLTTLVTIITGSLNLDEYGWWGDLGGLLSILIPISLVISILRYRLWDIDIIIRKTLLYGALTALLALVFFGLVIFLQQILGSLTNAENSPLAIVLSTLAIAALFNPLRVRLQAFIDRRFYRRKYDAEKTLEAFAQTTRSEVEIDLLTGELLELVQETFSPTSIGLWIKPKG